MNEASIDSSATLFPSRDSRTNPTGRELEVNVSALSKTYGRGDRAVEALREVSLGIRAGEFVSVLGPSGCGKSTLLMIVAGLRRASDGRVRVGGEEVRGPQTQIGIVFQSPLLLDWRDVLGNVMIEIEARRHLKKSHYRVRALELLESVGLSGFERRRPRELSGGMQQRVAICRALVHDPHLLLMDEPFGALDALTREQMMADLQRLWYEHRKTVMFVTHSIPEAVYLSDRVVLMTPRPGEIERVIDIDLERPRRLSMQATADFGGYVGEIVGTFKSWGVLRED